MTSKPCYWSTSALLRFNEIGIEGGEPVIES